MYRYGTCLKANFVVELRVRLVVSNPMLNILAILFHNSMLLLVEEMALIWTLVTILSNMVSFWTSYYLCISLVLMA